MESEKVMFDSSSPLDINVCTCAAFRVRGGDHITCPQVHFYCAALIGLEAESVLVH